MGQKDNILGWTNFDELFRSNVEEDASIKLINDGVKELCLTYFGSINKSGE
jgi:hypothetical protein